jgi:hypothetical protein
MRSFPLESILLSSGWQMIPTKDTFCTISSAHKALIQDQLHRVILREGPLVILDQMMVRSPFRDHADLASVL